VPLNSARRGLLASHLADALYRIGDRTKAEQVARRELEHVSDPDAFVGLHWTLAQCHMLAGASAESLATLHRVLAVPGLSARHRSRLLVLAARTHTLCGELEKGNQLASFALAEAEEAGDTWAMGWALHTMAVVGTGQGRLADALPLFDRALEVTEADPALTDLRALLQINKAVALANLDRPEEALGIARQAQQLARQAGATVRLTQAHGLLGQVLFEIGRWDDALAELTVMPESLKEHGAACAELGIAALISFYRGDVVAAEGYLAAAVSHTARMGHQLIPPLTLALSIDHEHAGALPAALSTLTCWLDGGTEEITYTQDILPDAVRLAVRVGDLGTARTLTTRVVDFAATREAPSTQGNALYCRGIIGRDGSLLLAAAEQYRCASRPLLRAKALEAAASAFGRVSEEGQARAALAEAAEIYGWLGASVAAARMKAAYETVGA
jgi:tetratricopeptide (TPR) repeat protein